MKTALVRLNMRILQRIGESPFEGGCRAMYNCGVLGHARQYIPLNLLSQGENEGAHARAWEWMF